MDPVIKMVLMIAALFLLGALGELIFARTGIPDMIWLVAAGIIAGPVFKLVPPQMLMPILPFFGAIALVTILMGGGLKFRFSDVAAAAPRAIVLGLVGFVLAVFAICLYGLALTLLGYARPAPLEPAARGGSLPPADRSGSNRAPPVPKRRLRPETGPSARATRPGLRTRPRLPRMSGPNGRG